MKWFKVLWQLILRNHSLFSDSLGFLFAFLGFMVFCAKESCQKNTEICLGSKSERDNFGGRELKRLADLEKQIVV